MQRDRVEGENYKHAGGRGGVLAGGEEGPIATNKKNVPEGSSGIS